VDTAHLGGLLSAPFMDDHDAKQDVSGDAKPGPVDPALARDESQDHSRSEKLARRIGLAIALILLVLFAIEMFSILRR
jgi:hypothetical protein